MSTETLLYVFDSEDRETGKSMNEMQISLNWDISALDAEERKATKSAFRRFAKEWLDFGPKVYAHFGDECPDCEKILLDNRCNNKSCIAYHPEGEVEVEK